ncbi:Aste57867_2237 [Aphanomyces stellatus]|uniref:Aste57867_2237 protein n=1 Tax=Aphanomyces stellatus TaxID=120398 RepID=A0A485KCB2_9STRA|nr:hypothetical protein As57867_002232 [Aphanomyces stellatus]VFT79440.1 Aste57867_2237 [Aphanomyces stellatus]
MKTRVRPLQSKRVIGSNTPMFGAHVRRALRRGVHRPLPCPQTALSRHTIAAARCFSSSGENNSPLKPLHQTFLDMFKYSERVAQWDTDGLFAPSMSMAEKGMVSFFFQRYFGDDMFDLADFLGGAQVALDLVFHTMYSPECLAAAASDEPRDISEASRPVQLLESLMTRECVDSILKEFKAYHDDGYTRVELTQLDIHECALGKVSISSDAEWLYMDVLYRTTEHLSFKGNGEGQTRTEVRDSHCEIRFHTSMKHLHQLDWSIVRMWDD